MATYYYYTNAFDYTYVAWSEVGSTPYLGAIDYPTNYIVNYGYASDKREGNFDFQNSGAENSETLDKVELELYLKGDLDEEMGYPSLLALVWDGSSWSAFLVPVESSAWSWETVDITSVINSWAKLDGCRVYLQLFQGYYSNCWVDCMRLKATTLVAAPRMVGDGLTWVLACLRLPKKVIGKRGWVIR